MKSNVTKFRKDETIQLKQNDALCLSVYAENSGGDLDVDLQFKETASGSYGHPNVKSSGKESMGQIITM